MFLGNSKLVGGSTLDQIRKRVMENQDAFLRQFEDKQFCGNYLFEKVGGHSISCKTDGCPTAWKQTKKPEVFRCLGCGKQVRPLSRTILKGSHLPLNDLFKVINYLVADPRHLHRHARCDVKTARKYLKTLGSLHADFLSSLSDEEAMLAIPRLKRWHTVLFTSMPETNKI